MAAPRDAAAVAEALRRERGRCVAAVAAAMAAARPLSREGRGPSELAFGLAAQVVDGVSAAMAFAAPEVARAALEAVADQMLAEGLPREGARDALVRAQRALAAFEPAGARGAVGEAFLAAAEAIDEAYGRRPPGAPAEGA